MLESQIENILQSCMSMADTISVPKEHEWQEIIPRCYSIRDIMRFNCVRAHVRLCYGFADLTELMQEVMAQEFAPFHVNLGTLWPVKFSGLFRPVKYQLTFASPTW